jgi:hypothetical protein
MADVWKGGVVQQIYLSGGQINNEQLLNGAPQPKMRKEQMLITK